MSDDVVVEVRVLTKDEFVDFLVNAMLTKEEVWRDDETPRYGPTVNFVAIHATDHLYQKGIHDLVIRHVDTFPYGKGFMASVMAGRGTFQNSKVFYGKGPEAYRTALAEGRKMLDERHAELERTIAEHEARVAELRRTIRPKDRFELIDHRGSNWRKVGAIIVIDEESTSKGWWNHHDEGQEVQTGPARTIISQERLLDSTLWRRLPPAP